MPKQQQTTTIEQALDLATKHQNAGKLNEAENVYQQILNADPNQPIALHMLGVIAHQLGKNEVAVELITKALNIKPGYSEAHNNLGIVFQHQGRLEEAIISYRKALSLEPNYAEVYNNLGLALLAANRPKEAATNHEKAIKLKPEYAEALNHLGTAYRQLGRKQDAIQSYQKALALKPNFIEVYYHLALLFQELGQPDKAVVNLQRALAIKPDYTPALLNLGALSHELHDTEGAITNYQKALAHRPDFAEAHNNLGAALQSQGRFDEAMASYRKAIGLRPNYAEARNNLGLALRELAMNADLRTLPPVIQHPMDEAIASYREALDLKPNYAEAHYNLANAFQDIGRLDESAASYLNAVTFRPDFVEAWTNFSSVIKALQFSKGGDTKELYGYGEGLTETARASADFAMLEYWLDTFRPHESDETFRKATARLPAKTNEILTINDGNEEQTNRPSLPDKIVALLHFGRSGTGLLHSLIDGHPEISTLPSIYLRGFFNAGVWNGLIADGWRNLPKRFADEFAVLFDANSPKTTPGALTENSSFLGKKEGMNCVGENRDESLSLDRDQFCSEALQLMSHFKKINPKLFLLIVHAAFEKVLGTKTKKHTTFYHLHNPINFTKLNFLRHILDARLIMMVREPVQSCESWVRFCFIDNDYADLAHRIITMLLAIDQIAFRKQDSIGVRLEDLKAHPKATLQSLCNWLGIQEKPCLYEMTAQGKKWWGDPTSPDYNTTKAMSPFDEESTCRPTGTIFNEQDQFILKTLFYPFRVRFGYQDPDAAKFEADLKAIQPLFNDMLGFEETMLHRTKLNPDQFQRSGPYLLLRACLQDRWNVLNQFKDYPHMLSPLTITPDKK